MKQQLSLSLEYKSNPAATVDTNVIQGIVPLNEQTIKQLNWIFTEGVRDPLTVGDFYFRSEKSSSNRWDRIITLKPKKGVTAEETSFPIRIFLKEPEKEHFLKTLKDIYEGRKDITKLRKAIRWTGVTHTPSYEEEYRFVDVKFNIMEERVNNLFIDFCYPVDYKDYAGLEGLISGEVPVNSDTIDELTEIFTGNRVLGEPLQIGEFFFNSEIDSSSGKTIVTLIPTEDVSDYDFSFPVKITLNPALMEMFLTTMRDLYEGKREFKDIYTYPIPPLGIHFKWWGTTEQSKESHPVYIRFFGKYQKE